MKPALRTSLAVGVVLILAVVSYSTFRSRVEEDAAQLERALLKREFVERTSVARGLATDRLKEWKDEIRAILRWYFDEATAIQNRHPGEKRSSGSGNAETKLLKESDKVAREEFIKYTNSQFETLRDGKYEPLYAAVDQGLHIDFLSFGPSQNPVNNERALRIDFALWGAPRRIEREAATAATPTTIRVVVPVAFKELAFKFFDEEEKLYGGMSGAGEPYMKTADPERFVEDFPPGVIFGTWYVDLMPSETAKVEMTLTLEVRGTAGSDLTVSYKWELKPKDEWKLRPGEVYKTEVQPK